MRYSIGTLVTDHDMYHGMKESFAAKGFVEPDCEFLTIDNTSEQVADAYTGLNTLLNAASASIVILCHQDILLLEDDITALDRRLAELSELDPHWAVAGNAGGVAPGELTIRISDKHGDDQARGGSFPVRVMALDENLLIVRKDTRVGFSGNLTGFHMYGGDICLVADIMGYGSYVIDFHVRHLGAGTTGPSFARSIADFTSKWQHALRHRTFQTTCARVELSTGVVPKANAAFKAIGRKVRRALRRRAG